MTHHQCCIEWTKDTGLPFRAVCVCGWSSMKVATTKAAGADATHHCVQANGARVTYLDADYNEVPRPEGLA